MDRRRVRGSAIVSLVVDGRVELGGFAVDAAFTVEPGETVAIVGPNGAGKSTVLRAIAGLVGLASGAIRFGADTWDDAGDVFVPAERRRVGMVFQQYLLFDHLTALENVAFGLRAAGVRRRVARDAAQVVLDRLGVGSVAGRTPAALSGGQAQRVALARALVVDPAVLLLDEPLAALDASARSAIRHDLPASIGATGACRILVTHDPVDAHALADRVVVLEEGRVTQRGTLGELAAAPRSPYVADLLGTNFLHGVLHGGTFRMAGGVELAVGAHAAPDGRAFATVRPAAVALHRTRPEGSPRNVWASTIAGIDRSTDRVRVRLADPLPVVVEVTEAGLAALEVGVGDPVWASVKASEIAVASDA
jgi:molybdate transport system ATP-binding protein